jgi:hypothetical protein
VALGAWIAVVLVFATVTIAYRAAYGTFSWWSGPETISLCGRLYSRSAAPTLTRSQLEQRREHLGLDLPYPMVEVTRVPPLFGHRVLASVTPGATGGQSGIPCAGALYLETGTDTYRSYPLLGGP